MFRLLTDNMPLRWQTRLFQRMLQADIPDSVDLPTGLGKTSIIPIWLIAFAATLESHQRALLPRRLIYIVNRRTVVDQATGIAEELRKRIFGVESLRAALTSACAFKDDGPPLAISTLRGEFADNEEWKIDPARPAIVIGTIDMIGSKMLFSGYGDGAYGRSYHAGLTGQDALVIHDEAHLTPPFGELLRCIVEEQDRSAERPIRLVQLSATIRKGDGNTFTLTAEDEQDSIVTQRLDAQKNLRFHVVEGSTTIEKIVELAAAHEGIPSKVLVYVVSPEDAGEVGKTLARRIDGHGRVELLTGTIRGQERDGLVKKPTLRAFVELGTVLDRSVYLVSTSAGEVGIDLDADHVVCDLTTLDSMIQRLGRVNRRGGRISQVHVVVDWKKSETRELLPRLQSTYALLKRLPLHDEAFDASPRALKSLMDQVTEDEKRNAWSSEPPSMQTTDVLFDAWSLTSIDAPLPGKPEVASYLHGLTNDPPETWVVWRSEIARLAEAKVTPETLRGWFRACRIEPRERLRDRTNRVQKTLQLLAKRLRRSHPDTDFSVVILDERLNAQWSQLSNVVEDYDLRYRTLILPTDVGGLNEHGLLDPEADAPATDVADEPGKRERWLLIETGVEKTYDRLLPSDNYRSAPKSGLVVKDSILLREPPEGSGGEGGSWSLQVFVQGRESAVENPETTIAEQPLDGHLVSAASYATRIARALRLSAPLEDAIVTAAAWHDRGKINPIWQRFACNSDPSQPLAKSRKYLHGRALGGYRHEFGSLLEALADARLHQHEEADLILHLIAAHHDWARPHFEARAHDTHRTTAENEAAAFEVMRRFGRLQQRLGRWGLAWLESLLRCADIAASRKLIPADEAVETGP